MRNTSGWFVMSFPPPFFVPPFFLCCGFRLPTDKQKSALDIGYKIFASEGSFPNVIRRTTVERVCLPMLRLVHKAAVIEFFLDHILDLMKTVELRLSKVCGYLVW